MSERRRRHVSPEDAPKILAGLLSERSPLEHALRRLAEVETVDEHTFSKIVRAHPRSNGKVFSKHELFLAYQALHTELGLSDLRFSEKIRGKPIRTQSGVAPVTVLTAPYPCPGKCVFCPSDVRMPKSYLSMEPGAQRAAQHAFDPYAQTYSRLLALAANGHPTDKVELIILGGTWSSYPRSYQAEFIEGCFRAMNDFSPERPGPRVSEALAPAVAALAALPEIDGRKVTADENYNLRIASAPELRAFVPKRTVDLERLRAVHLANESSAHRCVGLSIETRPDSISEEELLFLRALGVTKIQLGVQSTSNEVLAKSQRGHDVQTTRRAFGLARRAGFKLQAHFMPNQLGAHPDSDREDFRNLFSDPGLGPDELKLYPTVLLPSAELTKFADRGEWQPYSDEVLIALLADLLCEVPVYCRVSRVIRDIPSHDVEQGTKRANLRELVDRALAAQGRSTREIRSREIRGEPPGVSHEILTSYETEVSHEHFLQAVTDDDRLCGFLRLSLPKPGGFIEELEGAAMIREIHVYGPVVGLGAKDPEKAQHGGLGKRLILRAKELSKSAGFARLAVISAVGTRAYYRSVGFEDGTLYQVARL